MISDDFADIARRLRGISPGLMLEVSPVGKDSLRAEQDEAEADRVAIEIPLSAVTTFFQATTAPTPTFPPDARRDLTPQPRVMVATNYNIYEDDGRVTIPPANHIP